jgi:hypothetical protein
MKNCLRSEKSPVSGTKSKMGTNSDQPGTTKRNQVSGKKYSGPNYPQKDTKVVGSGMK